MPAYLARSLSLISAAETLGIGPTISLIIFRGIKNDEENWSYHFSAILYIPSVTAL